MDINKEGIDLIKDAEGFSATPYICPAGKLTVGYGHTGSYVGPVTQEQAEELLKKDVKAAQDMVAKKVSVPLTDNQFSALVSFTYNLGGTAFANSTLLKLVNQNKFEEAAKEFGKWIHANGKTLPGLVTRREAEKQLFLT